MTSLEQSLQYRKSSMCWLLWQEEVRSGAPGSNPDSARSSQNDLGRCLASLGLIFFLWRMGKTTAPVPKDHCGGGAVICTNVARREGLLGPEFSSVVLVRCTQCVDPRGRQTNAVISTYVPRFFDPPPFEMGTPNSLSVSVYWT